MPLARSVPTARTALVLLLSINLMNYVDRQILSALEKPIAEEFGVGTDKTGWLPTAFLLAYMVFAPLFGVLADRMSRWAIVGAGVIAWSLASGGSGLVQSFGLLIVMRLLIGIGEAAYGPVAPTLIADMYPVEKRGKVLAWFYAAIPVGSAIGYVVGGQFHQHWHWAFYLTVPPGIALGVWALLMRDPRHDARNKYSAVASGSPPLEGGARGGVSDALPAVSLEAPLPPPPSSRGGGEEPRLGLLGRLLRKLMLLLRSIRDNYGELLRIRSYVLVSLGMTAMTFALGGIAYFMPRWLEGRGLNPATATTTFGAISASAGLVATLAGGWLGDKLRPRFAGSYFLVSGVGLLIGFPLFLLLLRTPFPAAWFVLFGCVFCLFLNTGPSNAIIANVTAPGIRATAFAANIFVIHLLGDAISPPIIGYVAQHYGHSENGTIVPNLDAGFLVVSAAMGLGGIFWLIGMPFLARDTAAVQQR